MRPASSCAAAAPAAAFLFFFTGIVLPRGGGRPAAGGRGRGPAGLSAAAAESGERSPGEPRAAPLLLPGPRRPRGPGARNRAAAAEGTAGSPDAAAAGQEVTARPGRGCLKTTPPSLTPPTNGRGSLFPPAHSAHRLPSALHQGGGANIGHAHSGRSTEAPGAAICRHHRNGAWQRGSAAGPGAGACNMAAPGDPRQRFLAATAANFFGLEPAAAAAALRGRPEVAGFLDDGSQALLALRRSGGRLSAATKVTVAPSQAPRGVCCPS